MVVISTGPAPGECAICQERQCDVRTACGHEFCRLCLETAQALTTACPYCRQTVSLFEVKHITTGEALRVAPTTIYGGVYVQPVSDGDARNGIRGFASYHFSEEECYISYEDFRTVMFGTLDDGSRLPKRKVFVNPQFDAATRVFTGDIEWAAGFHGSTHLKYRMAFSRDYTTIESGCVMMFDTAQDSARPLTEALVDELADTCKDRISYTSGARGRGQLSYKRDMRVMPTTIFGGVYVQGGALGLASYHFDAPDECYIAYTNGQCEMWPSLDDGSRPPHKKPFVNPRYDPATRTFEGDIVWAPTSWNEEKLWRYRMVFSEDFLRIEGGDHHGFKDVDATDETRGSTFGDVRGRGLIYYRHFTTTVGVEGNATPVAGDITGFSTAPTADIELELMMAAAGVDGMDEDEASSMSEDTAEGALAQEATGGSANPQPTEAAIPLEAAVAHDTEERAAEDAPDVSADNDVPPPEP